MSLINQTVIPDRVVHAMCNLGTAGNDAYKAFVQDRNTNGTVPMKRMNLHTWKSATKSSTHKVGSQVIELKAERHLFTLCLIVAGSRSEIDVRETLGKYLRSLFDNNGELLPTIDKSKLMVSLEECAKEDITDSQAESDNSSINNGNSVPQEMQQTRSCTVIDGMAVVQEMGKPQWVKTYSDLAKHFWVNIKQKASSYDEIHLVFDRYDLPKSLKEAT